MISRLQTRLLIFAVAALIVTLVLALLAEFAPWLLLALLFAAAGAVLVVIVATVVAAVAVAIALPPLRPIAEISILGKHATGLGKLLVRLLAFFGNTALAWLVALSVAFQSAGSVDVSSVPRDLWGIFVSLAAVSAYFFWLWIAGDLLRARKVGRQRGLVRISREWLPRLGSPTIERALLRVAAWLVGDAWALLCSLVVGPFVLAGGVLILYDVAWPAGA